jgi:hypothetical protein
MQTLLKLMLARHSSTPVDSRSYNELLRDTAVVVEGLGSLLLSPAASGGAVSEVLLPAGAVLPSPSLLWDGSLSSDDDDEVLAP